MRLSNSYTGINASRFISARTVEGGTSIGLPNFWSIRPPSNDEGDSNITITNETILKADGRWDGRWYDFAGISGLSENFSYSVQDQSSSLVTISESGTSATLNYTWNIENSVFRSSVFLSRGYMEREEKNDYEIFNDNGLIKKT